MASTAVARRKWSRRRRLTGTCWLWRVRGRREARSSSCPRQNRSAAPNALKPRIHRIRPFTPRWSCSNPSLYGALGVKEFPSASSPFRLSKFLCSVGGPFLCPGLRSRPAPRGAAVNTGRRPPPEAARSGVDGREHGARLGQVGFARPGGSASAVDRKPWPDPNGVAASLNEPRGAPAGSPRARRTPRRCNRIRSSVVLIRLRVCRGNLLSRRGRHDPWGTKAVAAPVSIGVRHCWTRPRLLPLTRVPIPSGTFRMGSDRHDPEESPAHAVPVGSFATDRHPVTNSQYDWFVEATGEGRLVPVRAERLPPRPPGGAPRADGRQRHEPHRLALRQPARVIQIRDEDIYGDQLQ